MYEYDVFLSFSSKDEQLVRPDPQERPFMVLPLAGFNTNSLPILLQNLQYARVPEQVIEFLGGLDKNEAAGEGSLVVPLDPLLLEIGYGLIPLVDQLQGAELLDRISRLRREAALELGLVVPRIRIVDDMRLEPQAYCFKVLGSLLAPPCQSPGGSL